MGEKNQLRYYDFILLSLLFFISVFLQAHLFFNWDAGWHMMGAERMLAGGTYSKNIFDDNLPMVFWYFYPIIFLHKITGISLLTLTNIIVTLTIFICVWLADTYIKNIYQHAAHWEIQIVRYALLILLLFFPGWQFAQRDMIVTAFCLPYICLIAARMENPLQKMHTNLSVVVGCFLMIGLAMNPFYELIPIALELQYYFTVKKFAWRRAEIITFLCTFILYLITIGVLYPDYFTIVIPSFIVFSSAFNSSYRLLLSNYIPLFLVLSTIGLWVVYKQLLRRHWMLAIWLCATMSFVVYVINKKLWSAHIIFFIVTIDLLFLLLLCEVSKRKNHYLAKFTLAGLISLFCLVISIEQMLQITQYDYAAKHNPTFSINQLSHFFNTHYRNASIYIFTSQISFIFPTLNYTQLTDLSPGPNCWMMPAIAYYDKHPSLTGWRKRWAMHYKKIFANTVISTLKNQKPFYVIVDDIQQKILWPFHYITYLSTSSTFRKIWSHYTLKKKIGRYAIYQYT